MFVESLEAIDINLKNKLIGWAAKNSKELVFDVVEGKRQGTRRIFTLTIVVDGENISSGTGLNKKDAGLIATQLAIEKLGL